MTREFTNRSFKSAFLVALVLFIVSFQGASAAEFTQKELAYMPATQQIELFKRGTITPMDVLKAQKVQYDCVIPGT